MTYIYITQSLNNTQLINVHFAYVVMRVNFALHRIQFVYEPDKIRVPVSRFWSRYFFQLEFQFRLFLATGTISQKSRSSIQNRNCLRPTNYKFIQNTTFLTFIIFSIPVIFLFLIVLITFARAILRDRTILAKRLEYSRRARTRIRVAYALKIHTPYAFSPHPRGHDAPTFIRGYFIRIDESARGRATRKPRGNRVKGQRLRADETAGKRGRGGRGEANGTPGMWILLRALAGRQMQSRGNAARCQSRRKKVRRPRAAEMIIAPASRRKLTRVYRRNYMCISRHVAHGLKRPA